MRLSLLTLPFPFPSNLVFCLLSRTYSRTRQHQPCPRADIFSKSIANSDNVKAFLDLNCISIAHETILVVLWRLETNVDTVRRSLAPSVTTLCYDISKSVKVAMLEHFEKESMGDDVAKLKSLFDNANGKNFFVGKGIHNLERGCPMVVMSLSLRCKRSCQL
ncbi:hypothetical protein Fmac_032434 [Flemingia macrophylla]|uniref:Uncharacterized protein n=1 Tax=Flemingia macrophylla TaxID=520843 RepID=A0ABD1L5B1_9FABA